MLSELKAYSAMIRERREALQMSLAELALKSGVSTKTIDLIVNEKWPKNGVLSPQKQRGQGPALVALSAVLNFDADEWLAKLGIPRVRKRVMRDHNKMRKEDLEYLLQIVDLTGPLALGTLLDLLAQRSVNEKSAAE